MVSKVVTAGGGSGDKLPLPIKFSQWRASQIASDNQVQLLAFPCGLATKPGETVSTNRRRGEGGPLAPQTSRFGQMRLVNLKW